MNDTDRDLSMHLLKTFRISSLLYALCCPRPWPDCSNTIRLKRPFHIEDLRALKENTGFKIEHDISSISIAAFRDTDHYVT